MNYREIKKCLKRKHTSKRKELLNMNMDIDSKYISIYNGLLEKLDCVLDSGDVFQILYYMMDAMTILTDDITENQNDNVPEILSVLMITCIDNEKFMDCLKMYSLEIYQSFIDFNIKKRKEKINKILSKMQ
jgi:hypothetical protein